MPRTREFSPDEALSAAMRVFWSNGYADTSYDDLVAGTGVSRKGLYTVFGDKHALFIASLENYRCTVIPNLLGSLSGDVVSTDDIRSVFQNLSELAASGEGKMGCFMARTSADVAITEPEIKAIIDAHWDDLNTRLHTALVKAGYSSDRSVQLAPYFVGVMQGLFTLAHARADRAIIKPFVEEALRALD